MLLGCIWTYAMKVFVSLVFYIILFPLDGKIVTVDQLSFCTPDYSSLPSNSVPLVGGVPNSYVSIGIGLLKASSLMGFFPLQLPKVSKSINMLSYFPHEHTDPLILSAPLDIDTYGE